MRATLRDTATLPVSGFIDALIAQMTLAEKAGQLTVRARLRRDQLLFIGRDNKPTVETGPFDLWIRPSAKTEGVHGSFALQRV